MKLVFRLHEISHFSRGPFERGKEACIYIVNVSRHNPYYGTIASYPNVTLTEHDYANGWYEYYYEKL